MRFSGNDLRRISPRTIAEILVSEGEVSEEQVQEALRAHGQDERSLGEILISFGYITPGKLARTISRRLNVEYVVLSHENVDPDLVGMVGPDVLEQCEAIPLRVENGKLVVAMKNPKDPRARSCITKSVGRPIIPVAAAEDAIRAARKRLLDNGVASGGGSAGKRDASPASAGLKIGEILVAEGKISEEQLQRALDLQKDDSRNLGEILLFLDLVSPADLAQALARRLRRDYVALSELGEDDVDPEAVGLLDEETCRKYKVLPLRFEDERLVMAMSDPNDLFALEDLRMITGRSLIPVVVTKDDLFRALDHLYPGAEKDEGPATAEVANGEIEARGQEPEPSPDASPALEGTEEDEKAGDTPEEPGPEGTEATASGADAGGAGHAPFRTRRGGRTLTSGRIGEILVSEGKVSEEQLRHALEVRERDPRQVGEILLSQGLVTPVDLARALARKLRLDFIELTDNDVDRGALSLVDQKVLRRHGAVPLRVNDGRIKVAMSDPTDIHALEDLRMISGYPVTPVVATPQDVQRTQNKLFALEEGVSEFLQDAAADPDFEEDEDIQLGVDAGADEAPIIRLVSSILQQAVGDGASDIHIEPQAQEVTVRFRVDGVLREVMSVPQKLQSGMLARLKVIASLNIAERRVPQDGRFSVRLGGGKVDIRVATLPTAYGEKIVLRLLDTSSVEADLTKLGFSPGAFRRYEEVFRRPYGAILVTGPTGSGKSTTLYATLNELNSPERNIITIEDPIEYRVPGLNQIQVNPRAGLTFASGLRSILRSDPDVIMIGEIRDLETAKISVESALTGHLVLATLHTNNAPGALTRLTEMGVEPFLTSSAVDCVIAQRLARRLCGRCKEPTNLEPEVLEEMGFPFDLVPEKDLDFYKAVGCERCGGSGYRGRLGIYELMRVTEELRELILRRVSTSEISAAAEKAGMVRLKDDGLLKAAQGMTSAEEVLRNVV